MADSKNIPDTRFRVERFVPIGYGKRNAMSPLSCRPAYPRLDRTGGVEVYGSRHYGQTRKGNRVRSVSPRPTPPPLEWKLRRGPQTPAQGRPEAAAPPPAHRGREGG